MQISETCIRRPVMTTLMTASLIVFGFFAYRLLSVAALPAVDFPTIQINATLPGASPETMAASVAGPIERQLSTIAGITSMTSTSALGTSSIIIQFDLNRNIDGAALDVQTALTVAQRRLPVEMTTPPFFRKVNPGDYPILYISLVSATLPLSTVDDYGEILLAQQISQLPGIAQVLVYGAQKYALRVQNDQIASYFNNERAIVLAIQRQPDANTVSVVDSVKSRLPSYRAQIPAAIKMEVLNDRSISIRASVIDVQETLVIAITLVIMVIFLFLRSVSATIIPALAVPISLIATCGAMYAFGFSINNMTLLALTLSVGFVVDDAIVMLENIVRHIEGGMRPFEAALKGAREIGFTIVSITFSLIAVFIPVLLMGGIVGRVFREFAVSIAAAIVISGFVSLTLTPMLCARVLRSHHEVDKQNFLLRGFEAMFRNMLRAYEWTLDKVLAYKAITLAITIGTIFGTVALYIVIPKGFFPIEDTGFILAVTEGPTDVSFQGMSERQQQLADIIKQDPAVDYLNST